MSRTLFRSLRHPLVVVFSLVVVSCGGATPEQQLLTNFFRASRVRDNATLSNIAAVQFNPRTDGSVQDFEITSVGADQRRALQIRQAMDEAGPAGTSGPGRATEIPWRAPCRRWPARRSGAGLRRRAGRPRWRRPSRRPRRRG
jgi:hypothetical protein